MQFYQKIKKKLKKIFDFYQNFCYNKIIENEMRKSPLTSVSN